MSRTLVFVALAVFAVVALLPIVVMLPRIEAADLTDLLSQRTLGLLGRTLLLGLGTAGLALLIGVPFGYLVARTDVPGASLLRTLGVVPLLLPPLILAITWTVFLPEAMPSPAQAIFVLGLSTFPLVAVFTARAAERIDARLEEAALLAGGLRAVLRMELPLVAPAAACGACLAFAFAVNDFGVPDYVSSVGPRKFNVYADEITLNWNLARQPGKPVATALPLILLTLGTLVPALRLRRRGALATLGHGFQQPRALKLGLLRWPAFVFSGAVVVLAGLVPIARLAWEASASTQAGHSLAAFRDAMARAMELARVDLRNSFVYATCTALAAVLLGLVLG
ncbi:MAG: ABC transporter permease subunit, partial [Planctomycetota bacterium]|nr:ABC transporter permease subunit [Planctomycetota bacterium]